MKKLILATKNKHKISELKTMLKGFEVLSLDDIGFVGDVDETGKTTTENAKIKALAIRDFCKSKGIDLPVIADDSGLFVNSLGGEPGVNSARYAGNHDDEANRQKLLKNLQTAFDRNAYFECVICYASKDDLKIFIGRTYGEITTEKIGDESFGYDCLFKSSDLGKTFGEASKEEKDSVSHRGRATEQLVKWLNGGRNVNFDRTLKFNK